MDDLMRVEDIAAKLHIKPATIRGKRWQDKTHCPLFKLGKRLYVKQGDFNRWLQGYNDKQ